MNGNIGISVSGKTGKRQCFLFHSTKYLKEYLFVHPEKDNPSAPLWINRFGEQFSYVGIQQRFELILKKSGLKKHFSLHSLRHARATFLTEKGMNDDEKRLMFGWSRTSAIPARYTHITNETVRKKLVSIEGQKQFVDEDEVEAKVNERLTEERKKMQDEILKNLLETLKDPQHHAIQNFLFEQSEKP
jgi:integrase